MKSYIYNLFLLALLAVIIVSCDNMDDALEDIIPQTTAYSSYENYNDNELLQAAHIYSSDKFTANNVPILKGNYGTTVGLSGEAVFEQYYSVTPLYAYKAKNTNYVGDFYLVEATFSVVSDGMYQSPHTVSWKDKRSKNNTDVCGFYLTGYQIEIVLTDSNGKEVRGAFQQNPTPTTTIGATSYSSGITWSFDGSLAGGYGAGGLAFGSGCSVNSSKTRNISDVSISDNHNGTGKVAYTLTMNNLPKNVANPPYITRKTFDFHASWIWYIENTSEFDTSTGYTMKVKLNDLSYKANTSGFGNVTTWSDSKSFTFKLPIPNRLPAGKIILENTTDSLMSDISFVDSKGKTYSDTKGNIYAPDQKYEAVLPEGSYKVSFTLGNKTCTPKDYDVAIYRNETTTISSSYYKNQ